MSTGSPDDQLVRISDKQLAELLRLRLVRSEGVQEENCCVNAVSPRQIRDSRREEAIEFIRQLQSNGDGRTLAEIVEALEREFRQNLECTPGYINESLASLIRDLQCDDPESVLRAHEEHGSASTAAGSTTRAKGHTPPGTPSAAMASTAIGGSDNGSASAPEEAKMVAAAFELCAKDADVLGLPSRWQLDMFDRLPTRTADELWRHMAEVQRDRTKAKEALELLRAEVDELRQAQRPPGRRNGLAGCSGPGRGRSHYWWACCSALLALPYAALALALAVHTELAPPHATTFLLRLPEVSWWHRGGAASALSALKDAVCDQGTPTAGEWLGIGLEPAVAVADEGRQEECTKQLEQLQVEHEATRSQLARLQLDVDDAIHKGRSTVCWHIG
mmetsp:Transcript_87919/g.246976  ORF Transcript_87919/g.246976 Transcript_87919/m.246976 type:complete len:390 (-) Transcript_87919:94-1263(-)